MKTSLLPGKDRVEGAEGGAPEGHQQGHDPDGHQGPPRHVGAPAAEAHRDPHAGEDRDHRPPPGVVELAAEEPGEHLAGPVAVLEPGALEDLVARRPVGLGQHGHDHPGRCGQCRQPDDQGASEATPQVRGHQERPHHHRHERQVSGLEVQRDGEHDEHDRAERGAQRPQGPEREAPGEGEGPRRPQLGPHPVAHPDVGLGLVPDPGRRREERRHGGGRRGRPTAEAEQAGAPVHTDRPQGEQEVERPAKDRVGVEGGAEEAGRHGREALVVQELRRPEPEVGEPAGEREVAGRDPRRRDAHHLLVDGAVVEVGDRPQLGAELPEPPGHGEGHHDPGSESRGCAESECAGPLVDCGRRRVLGRLDRGHGDHDAGIGMTRRRR